MPSPETLPATDSAEQLRPILGDDATATFEDDPNFVESNPTDNATSENVEVQKIEARKPALDEEEEPDDDEEDVDEDDDLEDDEEYEEDEDDEDEGDDEEDDYEDDEDDEDDADEVKASSVLRADGLLGYEDEADDVKAGKTREEGDRDRARAEKELRDGEKNYDPNSHEDGKWLPVEKHDAPQQEGAVMIERNAGSGFIPSYRLAAAMQHCAA